VFRSAAVGNVQIKAQEEETLQNSETQFLVKAVLRKHYGFWMPLPFLEELIPIDFRVDDRAQSWRRFPRWTGKWIPPEENVRILLKLLRTNLEIPNK
jgi:hypothetical protein